MYTCKNTCVSTCLYTCMYQQNHLQSNLKKQHTGPLANPPTDPPTDPLASPTSDQPTGPPTQTPAEPPTEPPAKPPTQPLTEPPLLCWSDLCASSVGMIHVSYMCDLSDRFICVGECSSNNNVVPAQKVHTPHTNHKPLLNLGYATPGLGFSALLGMGPQLGHSLLYCLGLVPDNTQPLSLRF